MILVCQTSANEIRPLTIPDSIYSGEATDGYNPIMSVVPLDGTDVTKGMVAYLTLGVAM